MNFLNEELLASTNIAVRSISELRGDASLVIGVPGGPGISGRYLDRSVEQLAGRLNINGAVIDLPNHGQSGRISPSSDSFQYDEAREMLSNLFSRFEARSNKLIIYGHSLGAVIGMDLMSLFPALVQAAIFISAPTLFVSSPGFETFLRSINALDTTWTNEAEFSVWWRKIIPAYFVRAVSRDELELLAHPTYWIGNEHFNEGIPSFAGIASKLSSQGQVRRILYFEGEKELVLPENNFAEVKRSLPGVDAVKLQGAGHFPMMDDSGFIVESFCAARF